MEGNCNFWKDGSPITFEDCGNTNNWFGGRPYLNLKEEEEEETVLNTIFFGTDF